MSIYSVLLRPNVLIGATLFLLLNILQDRHHIILANLRLKGEKVEEPKDDIKKFYFLPKGLWFEYVDTPHYFCEILIYFSMLIICEFRNWVL